MKRHGMVSLQSVYTFSLAVALGACATTRTVELAESARESRARVTLAPMLADDTIRLVPQAIEPMLPSADRLARVIEARLGERATVGVSFCVSPGGRVVKAELAQT